MRRAHLVLQAAVVLTMVGVVSWPHIQPRRAKSVWRYAPDTVVGSRTQDAATFTGGDKSESSDSTPTATDGQGGALKVKALTSLGTPIPYPHLVLRDIQTGDTVAQATGNAEGESSFEEPGPDVHIVEVLSAKGAVLGTSTMVPGLNRGEQRNVQVRVPSRASTVRTAFSDTLTATSPNAITVAAANGVTRTITTQVTAVSPGVSTGNRR